MSRAELLCIVGPTACGKSAVAVELAQRLAGEVVSADSVAVYRGMDIGSAKPTESEMRGVRHHLIDCVDPFDASFSVSSFKDMARLAIADIQNRGKLPIITGGSGLYVDAILNDMNYSAPRNELIRKQLEAEYAKDKAAVYARLGALDSKSCERIHINDQKRVVRALEVCLCTGMSFSELNREYESAQSMGLYDCEKVGLTMERELLYKRINARVDRMITLGLMDEAKKLYDANLARSLPAAQAIGYAQFFELFDGKLEQNTAIEEIKKATRHFAKRQFTWFKRDKSTTWFVLQENENCANAAERIIDHLTMRGRL